MSIVLKYQEGFEETKEELPISQVSVFSSLNRLLTTIHMSSFNLVLIPNMVPELFPLIEK
jgi:hypothetical protein